MTRLLRECWLAAPGGCVGLVLVTLLDVWEALS